MVLGIALFFDSGKAGAAGNQLWFLCTGREFQVHIIPEYKMRLISLKTV